MTESPTLMVKLLPAGELLQRLRSIKGLQPNHDLINEFLTELVELLEMSAKLDTTSAPYRRQLSATAVATILRRRLREMATHDEDLAVVVSGSYSEEILAAIIPDEAALAAAIAVLWPPA